MKPPWFRESRLAQLRVAWFATWRRLPGAVPFLALAGTATAQEAVRYSWARQDRAEARKRALDYPKFNAKLGTLARRFAGCVGIEAMDNVLNSGSHPQADRGLRPLHVITVLTGVRS